MDPAGSLRALPSIDRLLLGEAGRALVATYSRDVVVEALRAVLQDARESIRRGEPIPTAERLIEHAGARLDLLFRPSPRRVINATGVILHTNLGRAPLSGTTIAAMESVARGYSALEYDVEAGERGSRHEHVSGLLRRLTGAEAALVVNNNASAVLLALAALAFGKDVIISRGQLVEIGGGFRIPDVLRQSGARLVEVGTTNRTYVQDYEAALTDDTALLLRVHASNFRVVGFVHAPTLEELVALAHRQGRPLVDDLGSGSLLRTEAYGLAHEPMVQESVQVGVDLICFSGDKLLGGPQAGILVGTQETIGILRRHPLTRALRPDKATIAGLGATLLHYVRGEAEREVPVWRMISTSLVALEERAGRILAVAGVKDASITESRAAVGGGSTPGETLPSRCIAVRAVGEAPQALAGRLRHQPTPIITHIAEDHVLLDLRTIQPDEDAHVATALRAALASDADSERDTGHETGHEKRGARSSASSKSLESA